MGIFFFELNVDVNRTSFQKEMFDTEDRTLFLGHYLKINKICDVQNIRIFLRGFDLTIFDSQILHKEAWIYFTEH